jgi:hypothetical protein
MKFASKNSLLQAKNPSKYEKCQFDTIVYSSYGRGTREYMKSALSERTFPWKALNN